MRRGITAALLIGAGMLVGRAILRRNDKTLRDVGERISQQIPQTMDIRYGMRNGRMRMGRFTDSRIVQQARHLPGNIFPIRPRRRIGPVVLPGRYGPVKLRGRIGPVRVPEYIGPVHMPESLRGIQMGPVPLPRVFAARTPK